MYKKQDLICTSSFCSLTPPSHNLHPQHFTSSTLNTYLQVFLHVRHLVQQAATPDMFSINIKSGEGVFLSSFSFIFYRCYISCNSVSLILRLHALLVSVCAPFTLPTVIAIVNVISHK